MIEFDLDEARDWFGFGVAGNFAGHLEQAGEAVDFAAVESKGDAPKGIFPWYAPGHDSFLGEFPLSYDALIVPAMTEADGPLNLQIEPEVGLACRVTWEGDTVVSLSPFALGAFNDCSHPRSVTRKTGVRPPKGLRESSSTFTTSHRKDPPQHCDCYVICAPRTVCITSTA